MTRLAFSGVIGLCLMATVVAQSDVLTTLGTNQREAHDSMFTTIASGAFTLAGERKVFTSASPEQRAAITRAVIAAARAFVGTAAFAERYAAYRKLQEPHRNTEARTGDEARAEQQAAMEQAIRESLEIAKQMPPEVRRELEANVAEMRKQMAELNADPQHRAMVDEATTAAAKDADAEYERQLAAWKAEYPEDPNRLIGRRLRQFLEACGDVDFDAKVELDKNKKYKFVNPAYEQRSSHWKMCYRAGKPAVDVARAAAEEWLKQLEKF